MKSDLTCQCEKRSGLPLDSESPSAVLSDKVPKVLLTEGSTSCNLNTVSFSQFVVDEESETGPWQKKINTWLAEVKGDKAGPGTATPH